jgi:hypothetical protein
MPNVLLVASSQECLEVFERLANRLREEEHSPLVMTWHDTSAPRLQTECQGKHLAVVGIMGDAEEIRKGFDALRVIAERCFRTAVGICLDAEGYKFYARQKHSPNAERLRFAILCGEPDRFPHARSLVRIGGKRPLVREWSSKDLDAVTHVIRDEAALKVFAA